METKSTKRRFRYYPLTGLKILIKLLLLLPILAFMVWFNYTVDVSSLFGGARFDEDIATALAAGEAVDNYDRMNEREILDLLAKTIEEPYEVMSVGSSRVLQLRSDVVGSQRFFNAGLSGADLLDIVGIPYLFDRQEKRPEVLILELDPWILNAAAYDGHALSNRNLFDEFFALRLGKDTGFEAEDPRAAYEALVDPTYFQGNLRWYREDKGSYTPPTIVQGDVCAQDTNVKLGDGSVVYEQGFRNWTAEEVEFTARTQAEEFFGMDNYEAPDAELCAIFDEFVQYWRSAGTEVVFLLTPYHPLVYDYAVENAHLYPGFFKTGPWFEEYARENDIPLYGSYNPYVCGLLAEEFYDGLHMHEEGLGQIFPGVGAMREAAEAGWAASPWYTGRVAVEQEIAQTLVERRQEDIAQQGHLLKPLPDEQITGRACWRFGRYETDEEDAVLLAQYCVGKDDGTVYRLDDDEGWVVDSRYGAYAIPAKKLGNR